MQELKEKLAAKRIVRENKERTLETMRSLVQLKNTLESSKKRFEQQVKSQNEKNTQLEKELVDL